jgi:predicted porin
LQAKFSQAAVLRIGSADLPWIPFEESIYGYRYVEKTQIDRLGLGTSADYGLHLGGTVADGLVSYAGSVVNGAGYKHFQHSKSVDVEGRVSVNPIKELTLAAGLYSGKLGKDKESDPAEHTATRYDALVAFVTKQFRIGGSYFQAKNWNLVQTDPITPLTDKAEGFSVYGSFYFTPVASVFARYDYTKPSKRLDNDLKEDYFNVGAAYSPTKGVDLAVVYKYTKRDNDITETKRNEIGVFGQLAF